METRRTRIDFDDLVRKLASEASILIGGGHDKAPVETAYQSLSSLVSSIVNLDMQASNHARQGTPDAFGCGKAAGDKCKSAIADFHAKSVKEHVPPAIQGLVDSLSLASEAFGDVMYIARALHGIDGVEISGTPYPSYADIPITLAGNQCYAMLRECQTEEFAEQCSAGMVDFRTVKTATVIEGWDSAAEALLICCEISNSPTAIENTSNLDDQTRQTEPPEDREESANENVRANVSGLFLDGYEESNPGRKELVELLYLERAKAQGDRQTDSAVARKYTDESDPKASPKADSLLSQIRRLKRQGKVDLS